MNYNTSNVTTSIDKMHLETHDLTEISDRISKNAAFLKDFLIARGLPQPSFDTNAPSDFPKSEKEVVVQFARESILEDTKTLFDLVLGPVERLKWTIWPVIEPVYAHLGQNPLMLTFKS